MKSKGKKAFVGLSGGVDSAVSAALLKKEGYEVTGVFIKAWTPPDSSQGKPKYPCTWREDRRSAMRAAAILDMPFITLDLEEEYKKEVVDYMISEYKAGRTPNPDVMCNKEIKFGHFLKFALENGADFVATGHYARTEPLPSPSPYKGEGEGGEVSLLEGADKNKDQSYFLWTLTQDQLKHTLFPIGRLQKSEVRKLAGKFGLPQETRKDSQGLCFLGKIDMKEFLSDYADAREGDVVNEKGEAIGRHSGAVLYTLGERHGFSAAQKTAHSTPMYVVAKDIKNNTVTVAPKISLLATERFSYNEAVLEDTSWISGKAPDTAKRYSARLRYRQEKIGCRLVPVQGSAGQMKAIFEKPQAAVSPGQSLVVYEDEICLGGGIIS